MKIITKSDASKDAKAIERTKSEYQVRIDKQKKNISNTCSIYVIILSILFSICCHCFRNIKQILKAIRYLPFLVTMHYAFQTNSKLYLVLGMNEYLVHFNYI